MNCVDCCRTASECFVVRLLVGKCSAETLRSIGLHCRLFKAHVEPNVEQLSAEGDAEREAEDNARYEEGDR